MTAWSRSSRHEHFDIRTPDLRARPTRRDTFAGIISPRSHAAIAAGDRTRAADEAHARRVRSMRTSRFTEEDIGWTTLTTEVAMGR